MAQESAFAPVERLPETGIKMVIAGAGVGGLWTALEGWRKGHEVRVFDRTDSPQTHGDFFTLNPASCRAFEHWPQMKAEHEAAACRPLISCYGDDGTCIASNAHVLSETTDETGATVKLDVPVFRHLRPRLQQILLRQLERIGVPVEYGYCAVKYEENSEKGWVELEDGSKIEGDVVVAADGLGTKSFQLVLGHPIRARSSGYAIYRCAYPVEILDADPVLAEHFKLVEGETGAAEMWLGAGLHGITTRNDNTFSWGINHKDDGTSQESWHSTSTPCRPIDVINTIVKAWGACPEVLKRMILATPPDELVDFKIMWRDAQPTWTSPLGRVIQIGDAAHTFVPSSGNGANQAIEDAISLTSCLRIAGKGDIPTAVRAHNLLRFERVSCCQIVGFQNQANRHMADWRAVANNPDAMVPKIGRWIWSHDAEKYAEERYEEAQQHLTSGAPFKNTNIPAGYSYKPWNIDELLAIQDSGKKIVFEGDWN